MKPPPDFRPFVPTPDYPRVAGMLGLDAHEHGAAGLAHPMRRELLFDPWEALYAEPFNGVTTDGHAIGRLFAPAAQGAPTAAVAAAAERLLGGLPAELKAALLFPADAREWRRWNNTEMYTYKYGLRLEEVAEAMREAILAVVQASLSARGFEKTRDVMRLNHYLGQLVGNTRVLGEWSFNFALFGLPSMSQPWGWQLAGHHLALNCFLLGEQMVLTPAFMGAEPTYADSGPFAGTRLFADEESRGVALLRSLSPAQQRQAILYHSGVGGDLPPGRRHRADQLHLGGAFQDNRVVPYEGIAGATFNAGQRRDLLDLVQAFVEPLPDGPRTARIDEVERHLGETRFCWIGGSGEDDTFYYRVQSPVVMIEFDHHSGVYLTNPLPARFHIHTIVRTPNGNDYGADLLRQHYRRDHHPGTRPGEAAKEAEHRDAQRAQRGDSGGDEYGHHHHGGHDHQHHLHEDGHHHHEGDDHRPAHDAHHAHHGAGDDGAPLDPPHP